MLVMMDKDSKEDQDRGKGREQGKEQIKGQSWRVTVIKRKLNSWEGIHEEMMRLKRQETIIKMIIEEIMKSKKKDKNGEK